MQADSDLSPRGTRNQLQMVRPALKRVYLLSTSWLKSSTIFKLKEKRKKPAEVCKLVQLYQVIKRNPCNYCCHR